MHIKGIHTGAVLEGPNSVVPHSFRIILILSLDREGISSLQRLNFGSIPWSSGVNDVITFYNRGCHLRLRVIVY